MAADGGRRGPRAGEPRADPGHTGLGAHDQMGAAVRRGAHRRFPGAGRHRESGGPGTRRCAGGGGPGSDGCPPDGEYRSVRRLPTVPTSTGTAGRSRTRGSPASCITRRSRWTPRSPSPGPGSPAPRPGSTGSVLTTRPSSSHASSRRPGAPWRWPRSFPRRMRRWGTTLLGASRFRPGARRVRARRPGRAERCGAGECGRARPASPGEVGAGRRQPPAGGEARPPLLRLPDRPGGVVSPDAAVPRIGAGARSSRGARPGLAVRLRSPDATLPESGRRS
jgi:hypothetical protein